MLLLEFVCWLCSGCLVGRLVGLVFKGLSWLVLARLAWVFCWFEFVYFVLGVVLWFWFWCFVCFVIAC